MILFLYGPDTYRSRQKLKEIIERYKKIHQSGLNFSRLDLTKKDPPAGEAGFSDFKERIETISMFDEKKLIVLEGLFQKDKDFQEKLHDYLKDKKLDENDDVIVVIWEEEISDSKNSLFKYLIKQAKAQEFKLLEGHRLREWVKKQIENAGGKIDGQAIDKLILFVGNDLWRMANEVQKLINYKSGFITADDVELLVSPEINLNIFNTIDALAERNKKRALRLFNDHLKKGENENYLLTMFIYQFRNLIRIKDLLNQGVPYYLLSQKTSLHPFVIRKTVSQARNFDFEELKKIYHKLFGIDFDIKTGRVEPRTALELFIVEL